jgi:hypothetical protein
MVHALGKIAPAAAGTPQQISTSDIPAHSIRFQIDPAAAGNVFICDRSNAVKATRVGVLAVLVPNKVYEVEFADESSPNNFALKGFWVDADTNDEGAIVSYTTH